LLLFRRASVWVTLKPRFKKRLSPCASTLLRISMVPAVTFEFVPRSIQGVPASPLTTVKLPASSSVERIPDIVACSRPLLMKVEL
jgi:hypothetical protein